MAKSSKSSGSQIPKIQVQLMTKYKELLRLNLKHDYFSSGYFPNAKVVPTASTAIVMKQYQLQFRPSSTGFSIGYALTDAFVPLKEIDTPLQLSFRVVIDDPNFLNYTNLPYEFDDTTVFYFNNKEIDKESTETKNLSIDAIVSNEDKIEVAGPMMVYSFEEEQYDVELEVVNFNEDIVFEDTVDGRDYSELRLVGEPSGKYTVMLDGLEEKSFYVTNSGLKQPFGMIDVFIDPDDTSEYSFFDSSGELQMQEYNIHFEARSLRWKYIFIETSDPKLHTDYEVYDLYLNKKMKEVKFSKAEKDELENGTEVIVVWTTEKIAFEDRQKQKFKLKTKKGKTKLEWVTDLPFPSAKGMLKTNSDGESEIFSELIVYL
ncbi:MAG: hypothetical protein GY810_24545 [Aureispira sp.]|nr:hypothetical protein [Aureispira sp.]